MRCIFCKFDATSSQSKEHIIPESLGNKEHILPPGIVCDKCNAYFASKIEKRLLELPYFKSLRFRNMIRSKKGRYSEDEGFLLNPPASIGVGRDDDGKIFIYFKNNDDINKLLYQKKGRLIIPMIGMPEGSNSIISRFIGKVGIEALACRLLNTKRGLDELVEKKELDDVRKYVRFGIPGFVWPYHIRKIYPEEETITNYDGVTYQILHEFKLLYIRSKELYIVITIMGIEYCLNLGSPHIDGYLDWLEENNNKSPLDDEFCGSIDVSTIQ